MRKTSHEPASGKGVNMIKNIQMVSMIKGELENHGISSLVKSDFNSGVTAGFSGGVPSAIDLYIESNDLEKATPIINDLIRNI